MKTERAICVLMDVLFFATSLFGRKYPSWSLHWPPPLTGYFCSPPPLLLDRDTLFYGHSSFPSGLLLCAPGKSFLCLTALPHLYLWES